jgi:hypothetical protein
MAAHRRKNKGPKTICPEKFDDGSDGLADVRNASATGSNGDA